MVGIDHDEAGVAVRSGDRRYRAGAVILALAPVLIAGMEIRPALPGPRLRLQEGMRPAPAIKCALAYSRPFWRAAGLSGEAYSNAGVVRAVVDHSSGDGGQAALMAFIVGDPAREMSGRPESEIAAVVVDELAELFAGCDGAESPSEVAVMDWVADPWSAGCVALLGPGLLTEHQTSLRQPVGRIHFAGTETAVRWPNYLDGAVEAGQRAAAEVLDRLGRRG